MRRELLWAAATGLLLAGCAAFAPVTIADKPLPARFDDQPDAGPSAAQLSWREFFSDAQLAGLIDEALTQNPDVGVALQRIELARAGVTQATGALLPRVDLNVGSGVRKFGLYTMDGAGNATTDITPGQLVPVHLGDLLLGLQSSWEIDLWGKLRNQRQAALSAYLASVEGTHLVATTLVADVAAGWFELQALDRMDELMTRALERQTRALEVVRLQKAAGRATELSVQQFEAELSQTRALTLELTQQRLEAENRLNVLLGRAPQPIARPAIAVLEPATPLAAGLPSELLRNRPDIREAELQVQATQFDLKAAQAAFFPNINLSLGVGFQAFNPAFLFQAPQSIAYSVLGGLVAPLVNRSAIEAQFEGAKATQLQAMYGYQKAVLNAYVEVVNGLAQVHTTQQVLATKQTQTATVTQMIDTADLLYRAGKATALEVLLAQQSALKVELEVVDAWRRQRLASIGLYKALGGGWR